jgi:hypothetical protein
MWAREPNRAGLRPNRMQRLARAGIATAAAAMTCVLSVAAPAYASCAAPPSASSHQFTGLVLATSRDGRDALVRTLQGARVEVVGTPGVGDEHTSVDRSYQVGTWYVFDPNNSTSPFRDDICTATHPLPPSRAPSVAVAATSAVPRHGPAIWPWAVGGGAVAFAILATIGLRLGRRARRRQPPALQG